MAEKQTPEVRQLKRIEQQIDEIKERTGDPLRAFIGGILYGAGWIVGGILTIVLLSWVLSLLGVIPGLDKLAGYLSSALQSWKLR